MKALFFTLLTCFLPFLGYNQSAPLTKIWDKTFGGIGNEFPGIYITLPTSDGGFIIGGSSNSNQGADKSENSKGGTDYWVIKIDAQGTKIWDKTFGGNQDDFLTLIINTPDNAVIVAGYSYSNKSGDKSENRKGNADYWIVKMDNQGTKIWDKTFGGISDDYLVSINILNNDLLLSGYSYSNQRGEDKSEDGKGEVDYWLIKIDAEGNKLWDKTFGGSKNDFLTTTINIDDNKILLGGSSESNKSGDKSDNIMGLSDYWIIKIDAEGNKLWDKTYGGDKEDNFRSILFISENRYLLIGSSNSNQSGQKSEDSKGNFDYWIVKIDAEGNRLWDRTFGGNKLDDVLISILTPMRDILLGGASNSSKGWDKSEDEIGKADYWLVKIDAEGNKIWDKTYGGNNEDILYSITSAPDQSYLLAGSSNSPQGGDKSEDSKGGTDWWIIKIQERDSCNLQMNLIASDVLCAGTSTGSIKTQITSGTPPFEFALNESDFQSDSVFNGLSVGTYTIKVRDANGCTKTEQVTLREPRPLRFLVFTQRKVTCPTCEDGVIVAQGIGGMPPYTFSANGKPFTNNVLRDLPKGNYEVEIKDNNDCIITRSIEVK